MLDKLLNLFKNKAKLAPLQLPPDILKHPVMPSGFTMLDEIPSDAIYFDTDSIFIKGGEHIKYPVTTIIRLQPPGDCGWGEGGKQFICK